MNLEFHDIANCWPLIEGEDFKNLVADIKKNGVLEPIWIYENKILDGRNRWRASQKARVKCPTRKYTGKAPIQFAQSINDLRRHLSPSQKAITAARLANMIQGQRNDLKPSANLRNVSQSEAANLLKVSVRAVVSARKILEEARQEIVNAVISGEISIHLASQILALSKEEQAIIANSPLKEIKGVAKAQIAGACNNEWYTPLEILEMARAVLGSIDTDPASCQIANQNVKATQFFDLKTDGLKHKWYGNVFMNPPYSQALISKFCEAVIKKFQSREIKQAIVLVNNATETRWFQSLLFSSDVVCFPSRRIKFLDKSCIESKETPLQGQAIFYFGSNRKKFISLFQSLGETLEV